MICPYCSSSISSISKFAYYKHIQTCSSASKSAKKENKRRLDCNMGVFSRSKEGIEALQLSMVSSKVSFDRN